MATRSSAKKSTASTKLRRSVKESTPQHVKRVSFKDKVLSVRRGISSRVNGLKRRRPHRSFRKTDRRDYTRSLELPNYWKFGSEVSKTLWSERKTFGLLFLVYIVVSVLFVGLASQDTYAQLSDVLQQTGTNVFSGQWAEVGKASLLFVSTVMGGVNDTPSQAQQVYTALFGLMVWLSTVWLLRAHLNNRKLKLRDALYNSASPLFSTFLVGILLLVQMIPLAIALFAYSAAQSSGFLQTGVEAMAFWTTALALGLLSIYWATGSFIALTIVTLPGMYPMDAIKAAGDMVIGRRLRIALRILYAVVATAVWWVLILIPVILFDSWIKHLLPAIAAIPIVPIVLLCLITGSVIWSASYVYLLYRRIVDDDAKSA